MSHKLVLEDLDLTIHDIEFMLKFKDSNEIPQIKECSISNLGDTPAGVMASHFIVTVELENGRKWSCFVKKCPTDAFGSKYAQDLGTFDKEGKIYQELIPKMQKISQGHTPWTAFCYLTKGIDLIVLENLNESGFISSQIGRNLDFDHLSIVMQTLARMNASSIAIEVKNSSNLLEMFPDLLRENGYPCYDPPGYRQKGFESMSRTVQHFVQLMSDERLLVKYESQYTTNEIVNLIPSIMKALFELVKPSKKFRNVFNQSDLWANNVLFKYGNDEKIPIDCRLIDFQFARYVPPAFEIQTLLLTSTSRNFTETHLNDLLKIYHETLKTELEMFGIDVNEHLPRSELDLTVKIYRKAVLIENLCFFQLIYLPERLWSDLIDTPQTFEDFVLNRHLEICGEIYETEKGYREKIQEIILELLDIALLEETPGILMNKNVE